MPTLRFSLPARPSTTATFRCTAPATAATSRSPAAFRPRAPISRSNARRSWPFPSTMRFRLPWTPPGVRCSCQLRRLPGGCGLRRSQATATARDDRDDAWPRVPHARLRAGDGRAPDERDERPDGGRPRHDALLPQCGDGPPCRDDGLPGDVRALPALTSRLLRLASAIEPPTSPFASSTCRLEVRVTPPSIENEFKTNRSSSRLIQCRLGRSPCCSPACFALLCRSCVCCRSPHATLAPP